MTVVRNEEIGRGDVSMQDVQRPTRSVARVVNRVEPAESMFLGQVAGFALKLCGQLDQPQSRMETFPTDLRFSERVRVEPSSTVRRGEGSTDLGVGNAAREHAISAVPQPRSFLAAVLLDHELDQRARGPTG